MCGLTIGLLFNLTPTPLLAGEGGIMKKYITQPGQSLFDIAVTVYGNVSGVIWLMEDNNLAGPMDRVEPGQELRIRGELLNIRAKTYLEDQPVIATISDEDKPEGVGYWRVEDYVVQESVANYLRYRPGLAFVGGFLKYVNQSGSFYAFALNQSGGLDVGFMDGAGEVTVLSNVVFVANQVNDVGPITQGVYKLLVGGISTETYF